MLIWKNHRRLKSLETLARAVRCLSGFRVGPALQRKSFNNVPLITHRWQLTG